MTNHRAEAERLLNDADEWGQQAGEPTPEVGELACLAYSVAHALLAICDALPAADPAPTNPLTETHPWPMAGLTHTHGTQWVAASAGTHDRAARREEAELDTPSGQAFTARDKDAMDAVKAKINALGAWLPAMEKALTPEPDPLDEDDQRDRLTADSRRIVRHGRGHWHTPALRRKWCDADCTEMSLRDWAHRYGPLTFAPEAPQEATGGDLSASQSEGEHGGGGGADEGRAAMNFDTIAGDLAQKSAESLDAWIARQAATLGMTVAELAERFDLDVGGPEFHLDPNSTPATVSVEHAVRLLPKEDKSGAGRHTHNLEEIK